MKEIVMRAGLDIGNGYVKGQCQNGVTGEVIKIDVPSCAAYVTNPHDIKVEPDQVPLMVEDIFDNLDATFDTPVIKDSNRRLFGRRALLSGLTVEEFDVYSHISKANQDLSGILVIGCIAGAALKYHYKETGSLPAGNMKVRVNLALALPIREYKKYREDYAGKLKRASHYMTIHNFNDRIRVEIVFDDVSVVAEGASAQYAIAAKGVDFANALLNDCRKYTPLEGITGEDVIKATTTIGIDIGEGTANLPVFQNGKFNPDVSMTFDKGYGSVLNAALDRLQDEGSPFRSRKELADYLQTPPSAIKRTTYNRVKGIVEEEMVSYVNELRMYFVKVMSKVGAFVEVVYIYGGGATPLQFLLYPVLIDTMRQFNTEFPILYLDSRYSRYLNREGLFYITGFSSSGAKTQTVKEPAGVTQQSSLETASWEEQDRTQSETEQVSHSMTVEEDVVPTSSEMELRNQILMDEQQDGGSKQAADGDGLYYGIDKDAFL